MSIAANQMLTFAQADANFLRINPFVTPTPTNKFVTKAEALATYLIEDAPMSAYANNQLVPLSTWELQPV